MSAQNAQFQRTGHLSAVLPRRRRTAQINQVQMLVWVFLVGDMKRATATTPTHISDLKETKRGGRRVAGIDRRVLLAMADDRWQTKTILLVVVRKQRWANSPGLDDGALSLRSHVPSVYCPNLPPWCLLVLGTRSRRCGGPAEAPELCTCAREFLCWVPPRGGKPGGDDI